MSFTFLPGATGQGQAQIVFGEVAQHKAAPSSFSDPLYVVIPDWSPDDYFVLKSWPQLHGATLPVNGSACLLIFDSQGTPWCASWH